VGRKKHRSDRQEQAPRRGKHRSIRHGGQEIDPDRRRQERAADAPPTINLRHMRFEEARTQLDGQVRAFVSMGKKEILVVHGRGHNSPGGMSVLKELVSDWCEAHPDLVRAKGKVPRRWGGEGATLLQLRIPV